jgi:glycosyltransferase involved in cell wall biosynthesis
MSSVSILIPAHNDEEFIKSSIESALAQTYPKCEIVVVDDGSTDNTATEVSRFNRVTLITQTNRGAPAARNRALEAATGEYIQFLDADDLLHPHKIEAQVEKLEESPTGTVAVCTTCYFEHGKDPEQGRCVRGSEVLNSDDPVQWLVNLFTPGKGWGMVQTGAWLTPRSVINEAGPWKEYTSPDDDGEFFARVLLSSSGVRYVDEGCVYYRQHENATRVSGLRSKTALKGWLRSIDSKRDHLIPETTDEQREQAAHGLARQYWSLALDAYPAQPDLATQAEERAADLGFATPLHSISRNGWKGLIARFVRSLLGWRAARWCQAQYHRARNELPELLLLKSRSAE